MHPLLAQQVVVVEQHSSSLWGFSIEALVIRIIVIAAVIAVVFIALREFGVTIPRWIWQVLGVLLVAFVCIICIRLLLSM